MRSFHLTKPQKFDGHIVVSYGNEGAILVVDFMHSTTSLRQRAFLIHNIPPHIHEFESFVRAYSFNAVEADVTVTFDMFWNNYGIKRNRLRCTKVWEKMSNIEQIACFYSIQSYRKFLAKQENRWRTQMEPDTYLRERAWENEWK